MMTIRKHINPHALSALLELQPTHLVSFIGELTDQLIRETRAMNLAAPNCDQIREVESVIFGYVRDANPGHFLEPPAPDPRAAPRVIPHPNFGTRAPTPTDPRVRASTDLAKYDAENVGRQAVNAAWLVAHPDVYGYAYVAKGFPLSDPWCLVDGAEQMRDGSVTLWYAGGSEKNVSSDFELYVSRKDIERTES